MPDNETNRTEDVTAEEVKPRIKKIPEVISLTENTLGIVGSSFKGPAFVPQTFATYALDNEPSGTLNTFENVFGSLDEIDKIYESQFAAYEWFNQGGQQLSFVRILGVGNNWQQNEEGIVEGSGFIVGGNVVSGSFVPGELNKNKFSEGDYTGKVHFVGKKLQNNQFVSDASVNRLSSKNDHLQQIGFDSSISSANIITSAIFCPSGSQLLFQSSPDFDLTEQINSVDIDSAIANNLLDVQETDVKNPIIIVRDIEDQDRRVILDYTVSLENKKRQFAHENFNYDSTLILQKGHLNYANFYSKDDLKISIDNPKTFFLKTAQNTPVFEDFRSTYKPSKTPWVVSQPLNRDGLDSNRVDLHTKCQKLFRFYTIDDGEVGNNFRIRIKPQKLGSVKDRIWSRFSVYFWKYNKNRNDFDEIMSFLNLNLNPDSPDYIGRVIGTAFEKYNNESGKVEKSGFYETQNNFIRVEMSDYVEYFQSTKLYEVVPSGFFPYPRINTNGLTFEGSSVLQNPVAYVSNIFRKPLSPFDISNDAVYWGVNFNDETSINDIVPIDGVEYNYRLSAKSPTNADSVLNFYYYSKYFQDNYIDKSKNVWQYDLEDNDTDVTNSFFHLEKILYIPASDINDVQNWKLAMYRRDGIDPAVISSLSDASSVFKYLNVEDLLYVKGNNDSLHSRYLSFDLFTYGGFNGTNILDKDKSLLNQSAFIREVEDETNLLNSEGPTTFSYDKAHDILIDISNAEIDSLCFPQIGHNKFNKRVSDVANEERRYVALLNVPEYVQSQILKDYNFYNVDLNKTSDNRDKQTENLNFADLSTGIDTAVADASSYYFNNKYTLNFCNIISSEIDKENIIDNKFVCMPSMNAVRSIARSLSKPIDSIKIFNSSFIKNLKVFNNIFTDANNNDYARIINNSIRSQNNVNFIVNKPVSREQNVIIPNSGNTSLRNRNSLNRLGHNTRIIIDIKKKLKYNILQSNVLFEPNHSIDNKYVILYNILNTTLLEYVNNDIINNYFVSLETGLSRRSQLDKLNNLIRSKVAISLFGKSKDDKAITEFSLSDIINSIQNSLTETNNESIISIDI